jgi:mRNA biogenesis factor
VSDRTKGREEERERERQKELKRAFKDAVKGKRDPRRSVYFDEVWNPYGIPPPGMPWKERDEDDSEGRLPFVSCHSLLIYLTWMLMYRMVYGF